MQTYIDELDLGKWPSIYPDNSPNGGGAQPRPGEEVTYASPAQLWGRTEDYTALPWVNNSSGNLQNFTFRKTKKTFCSLAVLGQNKQRLEIKNKFCFPFGLHYLCLAAKVGCDSG